jgi:DNA-binding NarL/FixJ family response regulator
MCYIGFTKLYAFCSNYGIMIKHPKAYGKLTQGEQFKMLDHFVGTEANFSHTMIGGGHFGSARRHLAIVDQSRLRCDCLKLALSMQPRRWRVTDLATASEVRQLMQRGEEFDVILIGGSICAQIDLQDISLLAGAAPLTPILVAADCDDPERALAILRTGARGFLPTSYSLKVLLGALDRLRAGGNYVPLALTEAVSIAPAVKAEGPPWRELTRRQRDVLGLISEGKSNKLIADALTMSESTVKAHVKQIIRRLNVANRTQAALLASRAGAGH